MEINTYDFKNIRVYSGFLHHLMEIINFHIAKPHYICMLEASGIMRAMKDKVLFNAFKQSLFNIPDGTPIAWYGRLTGHKNTQRISGVEIFSYFLEDDKNHRHFLLGDTNETINKVIKIAKSRNVNLQISGYSPPFKNKFTKEDNEIIFKKIKSFSADIIWVSFGLPKQEKWMQNTHKHLDNGVMIGVGAAFRYYVGDIWVPPKYIQNIGMQWTSRLIENPIKYFHKEFFERIKFLYFLFIELAKFRLTC